MIRNIIFFLTLLCFHSVIFSTEYIVNVGGKNYTAQDIETIMAVNKLDLPEQAIQKLQREALFESLGKSEKELYLDFFGEKLDLDQARVKARDLAMISRRASTRNFIFESWLAKKAEKVPLKYLDIASYWDLVKKTNSYQIRVEAGIKTNFDQITYTPFELSLADDKVLSTRNKQLYVTGKDFNDYISSNYDTFRDFLKRVQSVTQVQNYLITRMTGEKISSETINPKSLNLETLEIERQIAGFIKLHYFDKPLSLKKTISTSPSEVMDSLYIKFESNNASKIESLRKALTKGLSETDDNEINSYLRNLKNELVKKDINNKLSGTEVREWMETSNFPGNFNEAKFVLSNKKYEEYLDKLIQENDIQINLIK